MRIEYFQLIDRVVEITDTPPSLTACAKVPAETTIFEGHFPGYPVMPGVLLIESMAQAAGFLLLCRNRFEKMPFLVGVREAKLRNFVPPSSVLDVRAEIEHDGSGYASMKTSIHCQSDLICNALIILRFLPFPNVQLREHLEFVAREIELPDWTGS